MRATYEQLNESAENSFLYRQFTQARLDAPFHFHPELELILVVQGTGRRMVGRQVSNFEVGELVLLGSNLPHTWVSDDNSDEQEPAQTIVIQFKEHFVGDHFWGVPETAAIRTLFQKAQSGILIKGKTREWAAERIRDGLQRSPFQKLLQLIEILHSIAISDELELIDFQFSHYAPSTLETDRFQKVYAFMIEHYREDISLETVANLANLTPTSFCRFFKKIARKTFIDTLTEFRVKHACQLVTSSDKSISEICFESGFGNISYFNKAFKKSIGQSPIRYRKLFQTA